MLVLLLCCYNWALKLYYTFFPPNTPVLSTGSTAVSIPKNFFLNEVLFLAKCYMFIIAACLKIIRQILKF